MANVTLTAEKRELIGKNCSYKLRKHGKVPAIIYSKGKEGLPLQINANEIVHILNDESTAKSVFEVGINNKDKRNVIIKDFQVDPVSNRLLHVDFYEVAMKEELEVEVAIHLVGEAKGVDLGGVLEQMLREVKVKCLPANIPEFIEVNISELDIGESIHLSDITLPEGVKLITDATRAIAAVTEIRVEEEPEEEVEGEEVEGEEVEGEEAKEKPETEEGSSKDEK